MSYLTENELIDRCKFYTIQLESLLKNEEEFKDVGKSFPISIHKNNPSDLRLLDYNDFTLKIAGYSREELQELGPEFITKHMHPYSINVIATKVVNSLLKNPGKIIGFIQYLHVYGNEKEYQPILTFSKTDKNNSDGTLCISLTSQMFYNEEMPKKIEQIIEMDEFKFKYFKQFQLLTEREKQILTLLAEGLNNPRIADRLFISRQTVETHRKNINRKLGIKHYRDVVQFALAYDLVKI